MEQESLRPCPFCGGEAEMREGSSTKPYIRCKRCGCRTGSSRYRGNLAKAWNARAAATDEQFSLAVHDGRAWQVVRTCHMVPVSLYDEEGVDGIECDECGWFDVHEWYDPMPEFCQNCGAKVVG